MSRCAPLAALLLALVFAPTAAHALPVGPTLLGGAVITFERDYQSGGDAVHFGKFVGPTARLGFELGDFWTSEFNVQFTRSEGTATASGTRANASILTIAGGYQLTLDILKKQSVVSPYIGAGLLLGEAIISVDAASLGTRVAESATVFYLEFHAVVGVRVNLPHGLGVRAELMASTYGGFYGLLPSVGVAYSW
ncbi:MAG: outer membrane beta-barrel protein [Myxococcales bacterium]